MDVYKAEQYDMTAKERNNKFREVIVIMHNYTFINKISDTFEEILKHIIKFYEAYQINREGKSLVFVDQMISKIEKNGIYIVSKEKDNYLELEDTLINKFISTYDEEFTKYLVNYLLATEYLSGSKTEGELTEDNVKIIDCNGSIYFINMSLLYDSSSLYKMNIILNKTVLTEIKIPFIITKNAFKSINMLLNRDRNNYGNAMKNIEDLYSFYKLFTYLGFNFYD
jgi:hypothetical protein